MRSMADQKQLAILRQGARKWNEFRANFPLVAVDLAMASLLGRDLSDANLRNANLTGSDLRGAHLYGTILSGANLREADLTSARLTETDLREADFHRARFGATFIARTDLSRAVHLESSTHITQSTIGLDTIFRSRGNVPEAFLRGVGVPETFITHMKALVGAIEPIQFYSCFISYSTNDQEFADRLYSDLQAKDVRCWFAPHHIKSGKKIHDQIDEALRVYDKLLLIISESSMKSEWVGTELAKARRLELKEKRQMLFPIGLATYEQIRQWECFDADTGKDSAREIREYFIPDFSSWNTDPASYTKAFDHLLRDLRTAAGNVEATSA